MKTRISRQLFEPGYALLLVMVFLGLSVLLLTAAMSWSSQNSRDTDRGNEYYTSAAAAEAATEKLLVRISRDYIAGSESAIYANIGTYSNTVPNSGDDAYWSNYSFTSPTTGAAGNWVGRVMTNQFVVLDGQYTGLSGNRTTYRVASTAKLAGSRYNISSTVWQDVAAESIPLFQFAIFYGMDLEMEPGVNMTITGRVHSNSNLWTNPNTSVTLTYSNDVTASGQIYNTNMPGDPNHTGAVGTNVIFRGEHDGGTSTLNLPIGTNNAPSNVYAVLQIPPTNELASSALGTNRFYNKADLVILVSNASVTVRSGPGLGAVLNIPTNDWMTFLSTNAMFYNGRETITNLTTQLDVARFKTWAEGANTNAAALRAKLVGRSYPAVVFIADNRPTNLISYTTNFPSGVLTIHTNITPVELGVRLVNGTNLPSSGLTVATPNPVYILGDYNTTTNNVNFSRNANATDNTRPAAVMGDAITLLSNSWQDNSGTSSGGGPNASDTTINAALLGGIVATSSTSYSGGVENFPRFLEDWGGHTLWYNGSMVVLFNSQVATGDWVGTGGYYNPPTRKWAFDVNYYNSNKLPPGTPLILFIERLHWAMMNNAANPGDLSNYNPTNYDTWPTL